MKTFKDLHEYIRTLSPMSEMRTKWYSHEVPETGYGLAVYDNHTQVNIIDMETGLSKLDIFFGDDEVQIFNVTEKGYADYDHPLWVMENADIKEAFHSPEAGKVLSQNKRALLLRIIEQLNSIK